jgi:hypothetical protein
MIRRIDPQEWKESNVVQVDSDASDNMSAAREIESWAAQNGFVRTTEYWLRRAMTADGAIVFRGICYRISPEEHELIQRVERETEERMAKMPVTTIPA